MLPGIVPIPPGATSGGGGGGGPAEVFLVGTHVDLDATQDPDETVNMAACSFAVGFVYAGGISIDTISAVTLAGTSGSLLGSVNSSFSGGGNAVIRASAWLFVPGTAFTSGNKTLTADGDIAGATVYCFNGGDTSDHIGTVSTQANALTTSFTAESAASFIVGVALVGADSPTGFTQTGGLTEIADTSEAAQGGGYLSLFAGYKASGSTSAQTIGASATAPEDKCLIFVEVK